MGLRGAPDKLFRSPHSPISRPGEGEQLPRSTETPTFAQTSHFKPTEKTQFYTGKTTVFEKFCFNTLSANRCNGFLDFVCVFFVFFVGSLTYFWFQTKISFFPCCFFVRSARALHHWAPFLNFFALLDITGGPHGLKTI